MEISISDMWDGEPRVERLSDYASKQLAGYWGDPNAGATNDALGRLLDILTEKGLLNLDEVKQVVLSTDDVTEYRYP